MDPRFNRAVSNWTCAAACAALVAIVFAASMPRDSAAVAEPISTPTTVEDAAAGITFKIVPADATTRHVSWAPLTGDGSN